MQQNAPSQNDTAFQLTAFIHVTAAIIGAQKENMSSYRVIYTGIYKKQRSYFT